MSASRTARRLTGVLLAGLISALAVIWPSAAGAKERPVKVMTRNLYLGADLTPAIVAPDLPSLKAAGSQIWDTVQKTNFPARATVLAREIADADPDLIGLQEAAHWYTGPQNFPFGGPATDSSQDFLEILRSELAALGSPYTVIASQDEANIEGPTNDGIDIRLLQRDVILAKTSKVASGELACGNVQQGNYANNLAFSLLGIPNAVVSRRGYVSADCTVNKRSFKFVNTHLEAFSAAHRFAQAIQLVGLPVTAFLPSPPFVNGPAGPASATGKVVVVGDLNSDPSSTTSQSGVPNAAAYNIVAGVGYTDTWTAVNPPTTSTSLAEPGDTSGFNEFVNDADTSGLDSRIDHILARGGVTVLGSRRTGTDPDNRVATSNGLLWPSDHAGVVATLQP